MRSGRILLRLAAGLAIGLWCGAAFAQAKEPVEAGNQIRLDRPVGGDDPPAMPGIPGAGAAGPAILTAISAEESQRLFQSAGFASTELVRDETGDYVRVRFDDSQAFIFHQNCTAGRCRSLLFTAFLAQKRGMSLNAVNVYNLKTIHTKLAKNAAGEIVLTMPASLDRGVTADHLRALAPFWIRVHRDALAWR